MLNKDNENGYEELNLDNVESADIDAIEDIAEEEAKSQETGFILQQPETDITQTEETVSADEPVTAAEVNGPAEPEERPYQPDMESAQVSYQEPPKKVGRGFGKLVLSGLLFGVIAGSTMVGVQIFSHSLLADKTVTEQEVPDQGEEIPQQIATIKADSGENTAVSSLLAGGDIPAMVDQVMPSVVSIHNTMIYQDNSWFGQGRTYEVPSSGSGFIVGENDTELLIVTNNHVVEGSKELKVTFINDTEVEAAIKGTDPVFDLAVIAVPLDKIPEEARTQIRIATLGDSSSLRVGETVVAIGNALGYGQSVTVGCVSALKREVQTEKEIIQDLIQTDAAINPGNSGGALLNLKGEVIGINAAKYASTEVEGMGYAIPISEAQDIIDQLMNKKTKVEIAKEKQGYLGIQGKDITDAYAAELGMPKGIYVLGIIEDGAAAQSDLRERDIITKFDDQSVRTMVDLQSMLAYYEGGETITLTVQSQENGKYVERTVEITLGTRPSQD